MRIDSRKNDELRPVKFETDFVIHPEGSVLCSFGKTRVLCNVSIEDDVPRWMKEQEKPGGWLTAEYAMLPRATHTRSKRETLRPSGRTQEISRLIGRALRAAIDLEKLGARTCRIDCDVLQADGGTRTASVTGAYVALMIALNKLIAKGELKKDLILSPVAAISVGILNAEPMLDLCYEEDVAADVDANLVMNGQGDLIEVQGTAEGVPFSRAEFNKLLDLADLGIKELIKMQQAAISVACNSGSR